MSEPKAGNSSAGSHHDSKDAKLDLEKLAEQVYKLMLADARLAQVRGDQTKRR
jgi:hypothetical protein